MIYVYLAVAVSLLSLIGFLLAGNRRAFVSRPKAADGHNRGQELEDYNHYCLNTKDKLIYTGLAAIVVFALAYVFYHSLLLSALLTPLACFYPSLRARQLIAKRKRELNMQFKDTLYSLSSSLLAGRSIESGFCCVLKDLRLLYPDPRTPIIREMENLVWHLEMNEPLEEILGDLAERSHLEDIESFVEVLGTCKRSGGDMLEIIRNTSAIIADKIQIKEEIDTMLAQRRFEQRVLNVMPLGMILLLTWFTGDYMNPVFETAEGRAAMTIAVILLAAAYYLGQKIMSIEV